MTTVTVLEIAKQRFEGLLPRQGMDLSMTADIHLKPKSNEQQGSDAP